MQEGILNYRGEKYADFMIMLERSNNGIASTAAVALWAMEEDLDVMPQLELEIDGVYEGGVGKVRTNNPGFSVRNSF